MNALFLQILIGVFVMFGVIIAFILSVKSGQYDDLDSPAYRILMDDDDPRIPGNQPVDPPMDKK
jgi:cbb3-type cytochrome oxidase maturation protein